MRAPAETAGAARTQGPRLSVLTMILLIGVTVSALAVGGWAVRGGRVAFMSTPSMCPAVCVGALVATEPASGRVHVGELVSFRPPGSTQVFTHRVVDVEANGFFRTKGDAESHADPWLVAPSEVVGKVAFTWWGVGWWLRALPFVAIGCLLLLLVRSLVEPKNRRSWERVFAVLLVVVPLLVLHPLIRGELIDSVADAHHRGWITGLVVNTGLLPAQFHVVHGEVISRLSPTHLHFISGPPSAGAFSVIHEWVSLAWWGWVLVFAAVFYPVFEFVVHRLRRPLGDEVPADGIPEVIAVAL